MFENAWKQTRAKFEQKQPKRIITYKGTGIKSHMIYEIFDLGEHGAYMTETNPKLDPRYVSQRAGMSYKSLQEAIKAVPSEAKEIDDFIPHRRAVEKALSEGKPVSTKVLADYPDILYIREQGVVKKRIRKPRPLPKEAENVQTIQFDSKEYTCYGKPVGVKSYRVYCRKK